MQHFLPKHSSSAAASSHPKMVPTKQPVKAAPPAVQPADRKRKGLSPAAAGPKSCCSRTTPQKASVMPPSTPFSSGCGWQSVCEKYCCEHWVLSHSAYTANHCYSEKNKTQTFSKREHFSSSPARHSAARKNSTLRHTGRGQAGHPRTVKLVSGDNKTRLYT